MIVVADTSGLLAALDAGQSEHVECSAVMRSASFLVSPLVLTELDHLVQHRLGWSVAVEALDLLLGRIDDGYDQLATLSRDEFGIARDVRRRYASLQLDLADCVGVALAHRHQTNEIFTLDQRDFRAITPLAQFSHFRLLPADGKPASS